MFKILSQNYPRLFLLLLAIFCAPLLYAYDFVVDNIQYNINSSSNRTVEVAGAYWRMTNVNIPAIVNYNGTTYSVTAISNYAFSSYSSLSSIDIPNSVTIIGENAFSWCSSLTSVVIPNSVTIIGKNAFNGCGSLTSVVISNSVVTIGPMAFYYCKSLSSVAIPASVTTIGKDAFSNCSSLVCIDVDNDNQNFSSIDGVLFNKNKTTLFVYPCGRPDKDYNIPNTVITLDEHAFLCCNSLTSVTIPASVTTIRANFYWCSSLVNIDVDNDNQHFSAGSGALFNKNKTTLLMCLYGCAVDEYIVPNTVVTIGEGAFYGCDLMTSVTIPNSVTTIGPKAFYGCSSLASVIIPNSVTTIGELAFFNCSLTSVEIPNSVITIGGSAFRWCNLLTSVVIPNSVTTIGGAVFYECSSLTSVVIPNSVTTIVGGMFYGCRSLTSVSIPNSVTTIGSMAFYECNSLPSIDIPNSVTTIDDYAFVGCNSLISVSIPASVSTIGTGAFVNCRSLTSIKVDNDNQHFLSVDDVLFNKNKTILLAYPTGRIDTEYIIPNTVSTIGDGVFVCCLSLTSVTIPNSVTAIGESAFGNCDSLTSVYCYWNTPISCLPDFSRDVYENAILYVPVGTSDAYRQIEPWMYFEQIEEMSTSIDRVEVDKYTPVNLIVENGILYINGVEYHDKIQLYDMSGRLIYDGIGTKLHNLSGGLYIVKVDSTIAKVIL